MGYEVANIEEIDRQSVASEAPDSLDLRMEYLDATEALDLDEMRVRIWYFEPGEQIPYHAQSVQEEFYYVLQGTFSLMLGEAGDEEQVEVGPGTTYAASPLVGHGHRCIGNEEGIVLAVGAPAADDEGLNPYDIQE